MLLSALTINASTRAASEFSNGALPQAAVQSSPLQPLRSGTRSTYGHFRGRVHGPGERRDPAIGQRGVMSAI